MTEAAVLDRSMDLTRSKRLKAATGDTHERLDKSIMAGEPFASRERYARLDGMLPDLQGRRRLAQIGQDLTDLGFEIPSYDGEPEFGAGAGADLPTALGWLYVAEGSNLGAAFLLKDALKLGLTEEFGARHLAGAPEGRGLHWRTFTAALDAVDLSDEEEARVVAGAEAAFNRVHALVRSMFG
jgi:heme oxygenase